MTARVLLALLALACVAGSPAPPPCFMPGATCVPLPGPPPRHYAEPCPAFVTSKEPRCVIYMPAIVNRRERDAFPTQTPVPDPGIE